MSETSPKIHPTAIVSKEAKLGSGVEIGPFCVLQGDVTLGDNVRLIASVNLYGPITIGDGSLLYPNCSLGFPAQDLKFKLGAPTGGVKVGRDCQFRENTTVHAATKPDVPTVIGDRMLMMACSHVAHDCRVGNDVVLVNGALLAGHVHFGDRVIVGGGAGIHQFSRVGRLAFVGGLVAVTKDVPPFCLAAARGQIHGLNAVGLRRNGVPREEITLLRRVFREVFRTRLTRPEMVARLRELAERSSLVTELADFVESSKRGIAVAEDFGVETEEAEA
jgi:UDP-N-acetylglucosamine acyltransferase